jgi:hypothetical protein
MTEDDKKEEETTKEKQRRQAHMKGNGRETMRRTSKSITVQRQS